MISFSLNPSSSFIGELIVRGVHVQKFIKTKLIKTKIQGGPRSSVVGFIERLHKRMLRFRISGWKNPVSFHFEVRLVLAGSPGQLGETPG